MALLVAPLVLATVAGLVILAAVPVTTAIAARIACRLVRERTSVTEPSHRA